MRTSSTWILFLSAFCLTTKATDNALPHTEEQYAAFASEQFPETENLQSQYDFIIIGAGTAGCTVANRLSQISDWKILLIEAGSPETVKSNIPGFAEYLQRSPADWQFETVPSPNYGSALNNRTMFFSGGKILGGSSSINFMIYTRGNQKDYDAWFRGGNLNWNQRSIDGYFKKLENYAVDPDNLNFGHAGPMIIQNISYRTEFAKAYVKAAGEAGSNFINVNDKNQIGTSYLQTTTNDGTRFSTNRGYLSPIRDRKNLNLKTGCIVTKINFIFPKSLRPTAKSVTFICGDKTFTVEASKEVIVSAGAIGSPKILMLSGIGPAEDLSKLNIPVVSDLPVGKNLMDHVAVAGLLFTINKPPFGPNEPVEKRLQIPAGIEIMAYTLPKNGEQSIEFLVGHSSFLESYVFAKTLNLNQTIYDEVYKPYLNQSAYTVWTILQKPKSRGWVKLRDADPLSKPLVFQNFFDDPDDVETLLAGVKESISISKQPELQKWGAKVFSRPLPMCANFEFGTDDYWRCHIKALPCTISHVSGTNKMGTFMDKTTVVNKFLMVHKVERLRVVDASIMPEIPAGHLNGPTIMIAELGADTIKGYWGK